MSGFVTLVYSQLHRLIFMVKDAARRAKAVQQLVRDNPTCRIMSAKLREVSVGQYVAVLSGAILDRVTISDCSYISNDSVVVNVEIGKYCSIGPRVQIGLAPHPSRKFVSTYPAFYTNRNTGCPLVLRENKIFDDTTPKTVLANDIWIGADAIIPGGIHIGTGAIVAAGAVVVTDVPAYAIVGGNPAKVIRYRFSDEQIKLLLASEWWDWSVEKVSQHVNEFSDVEHFQRIAIS